MANRYTRVRLNGSLPGGEQWSIAPAFIGNFDTDPISHADLQTWADDVATIIASDVTGVIGGYLSAQGSVDQIRIESYGPDGHLHDYAVHNLSPVKTGSGTIRMPATAAACVSLSTGIPGRSYRGRLYWPALGAELATSTGRFIATDAANLASAMAGLLTAIEEACPSPHAGVLGVWSTKLAAGVQVTEIRVGDVPDSMRSRKDALVESYSTAVYPAP